jgi:two-component system, cell cycle sensor histidine kinase and response regulator CckA
MPRRANFLNPGFSRRISPPDGFARSGASLTVPFCDMKISGSILIADNDPESVKVLADALRADGWQVSIAPNGALALAAVEARPSLILLSTRLAGIDGLQVCRLLKSNQATRNIPIILIIGAGGLKDGVRGLTLGAGDFIERPFPKGTLPAGLRTHLELERLRLGMEQLGVSRGNSALQRAFLMLQFEITARRRLEVSRREKDELTCLALKTGKTYAFEWNLKTDALRCWPEQSGSDAPTTGREFLESVHADDRENLSRRISALTASRDTFECDYRVVSAEGRIGHQHAAIRGVFGENGKPERYIGTVADTARPKLGDPALTESEEGFRHLADTAPMMICEFGPDMGATYFNKAWLNFTGRTLEEETGYGWIALVHPDDLDRVMADYSACFTAHRNCHIEYRMKRADGEYRWIICSGVPRWSSEGVFTGYVASCLDITDSKRAHEEAFDKQKLESLRALTGRIAHDFNNLLGGIQVQAELTEDEIAEGVSPVESIGRIRKLATHASEVVRELLIYSGREEATLEPINLSRIVHEMTELLKASISKHARLETDLARDLPSVLGSTTQMRQLVMNLILNASEAIGERDGIIRITTAKNMGPGGRSVLLKVADTGRGMTAEACDRIFDPFFTTKASGHGLGLAIVHGIVESHGGEINVSSAPGLGTAFEVLLPCLSDIAGRRSVSALATPAKHLSASYGVVLLVDEDDSFRISIGKALLSKGYGVLSVADIQSAMEVFHTHAPEIGAVVLTLTLEGSRAAGIPEQIERFHPAPIILAGPPGDSPGRIGGLEHTLPLLEKPYQIEELIALLDRVAGLTKHTEKELAMYSGQTVWNRTEDPKQSS